MLMNHDMMNPTSASCGFCSWAYPVWFSVPAERNEIRLNALTQKFKEVIASVLPITLIVFVLHLSVAPLQPAQLVRFALGAVLIILGLSVFLFGVDIGVTPIGTLMGPALAGSNRLWAVAGFGALLGFFISIAEPDLHILAGQVDSVTSGAISKPVIVVVVSVGIALLLAFGLVRIVYNIPLYKVLTVLYGAILLLALLAPPQFLGISFDASGATTGALTVPFVLALGFGVSAMKKDSKASAKDSFGLVAIASTGAILSVTLLSFTIGSRGIFAAAESVEAPSASLLAPFAHALPSVAKEIAAALLPLLVIFLMSNKISFHLKKRRVRRILVGMAYTFLGLVLFLTGVHAGFMDVGTAMGYRLASMENKTLLVAVGFLLGLVTILAEPAVHVLTDQIEEVTSGSVKRILVLAALSAGVGVAVALSMLRIVVPQIQLWHYLLPGYLIAVGMTYFSPKLFVGISFDSGGVASGPMTATFILAFAQGAADAVEGASVLIDGFGIISMVALTPLITLQVLGLIFRFKSGKQGVGDDGTHA